MRPFPTLYEAWVWTDTNLSGDATVLVASLHGNHHHKWLFTRYQHITLAEAHLLGLPTHKPTIQLRIPTC